MTKTEPLQYSQYYHIYNRGNNGEALFREERNYPYFLKLYANYIEPVAETYAHCLMSNHFHLLVRIRDYEECKEVCQSFKDWQTYRHTYPSRAFANLFGTCTKAFNKSYQRTGSLFEKPFRRKLVDSDRYFAALVTYIHRNPEKHGFVADFREWPYSSFQAVVSAQPTRVQRDAVLSWFNGRTEFEELHLVGSDERVIKPLIGDDFA
jgi:putative transposase